MHSRGLARTSLLVALGLLLAAGCPRGPAGSRPTRPSGSDPATGGSATASAGRSAFVVLAADETLVIPIDPALAVETLPGHWVGSLPGTPRGGWGVVPVELTTRGAPEQPSLPVCPSVPPHSCWLALDESEADPASVLATAEGTIDAKVEVTDGQAPRWRFATDSGDETCTCVVVDGLSTDAILDLDDPDVEEAMAYSGYDEEEYQQTCSEEPEPELSPTSYVGGVLYLNGPYSNFNCSGYNLYYGVSKDLPLRPGAAPPTAALPEPMACAQGVTLADVELVASDPERFACEPGEQMEAYALRHGRLVRYTGTTSGPEESDCSCASWVPASASSCPSPLDPCGQGRELSDRGAWQELWVTTDERLALALDGKDLVVLDVARDAAIRRLPAPAGILGVEHHPDTALLGVELPPRAARLAIPPRDESDAKLAGSGKAWGNRCFAHLQAGRLDAAEAACYAGLLSEGTRGTRGALTYNLGRIAEARGDQARAREYYERSQHLRPNDATKQRLESLGDSH